MTPSSLLLVGCGKMGSAMLKRWQETHPAGIHRFRVIEPLHKHLNSDLISWFPSIDELPKEYSPAVIVFAIKPQELILELPKYYERFKNAQPLYISIAAGKPMSFFVSQLGDSAHIVRAMPNSPALVGEAMTVLYAHARLPLGLKKLATEIMQAIGQVIWVDKESEMDAATALSGSGPAYVFLFMDSLIKAAVEAGLPAETAKKLASATVTGSIALANQSTDTLEQLRKNVTSPGGTTEAAMSILMDNDKLEKILKEAVLKAAERSRELSS